MNDDGFPIDSFALIGPFLPDNDGNAFIVRETEIIVSSTQQGPFWQLYASQTAEDEGDALFSGELIPGRNKIMAHARGAALWFGLGSANPNGTWALESAACKVYPMGITRVSG
jgi:hypothetical protein